MGPGATVGTPGLGYPLLLCLGKDLVIILNYIQTAGPLRSRVLFSQQRPGPFHSWERSGDTTCPGRGRNSCASSRGSGPPKETGPPQGPGPLMGSRTPCIITGPLTKGRNRHPASGWSGDATCLQDMAVWVSLLTFTHHCIHCGRWTSALIWQKLRRFIDQGTLLIAYYQGSEAAGAAHTASASLP